jgi:hypothetical protein
VKKTYFEKLRDPRWQRRRLEIMERDSFTCRICGDAKSTLNVHHLRYEKNADPWDYPDQSLITTCELCHEELHAAKFGESILEALLAGGADHGALYGVMYAFDMAFLEGPYAGALPRERWEDLVGALTYVITSVKAGATEADVRNALARFLDR